MRHVNLLKILSVYPIGKYLTGLLFLVTLFTTSVHSQWISAGSDIYYSGGKVGIGINTPSSKLHVSTGTSGSAIFKLESDTDNNNESDHPQLKLIQDGGIVVGTIGYKTVGSDNNQLIVDNGWDNDAADILFQKAGATNLIIEGGGNVGIGTTSPTQKLTVAGTINSQEIIVEEDAGADFVFESGYDLPTLPEVEAFVSQNNHLPGIAPASEMIENGVKVGELQMQLLQKIEELMLYTIEQQRFIENQQKMNLELIEVISSLEKKIETLKKNNNYE